MGFHINVWNMPRIETYDNAKEVYASKTAVRGGDQSVRRIGDRYEKEKWLRKDMLDGIEVYTAGYYRTDLVRFYPTHKEITLGSYPSHSTQFFVEYVAGIHMYDFEHKRYVPAPFTRSPMVKNNQIECFIGSASRLHMNAHDWYKLDYNNEPLNHEQFEKPVKYRFDASQMRELRKPYQKLLKYADTMLKLNSDGLENDEKLSAEVNKYPNKLELFADENKTYLAYYHLVRQCQHSRWHSSGYITYCNIGMIKRYLDKQIKLENPQVLVEVN